jgi:hypothetical protein
MWNMELSLNRYKTKFSSLNYFSVIPITLGSFQK